MTVKQSQTQSRYEGLDLLKALAITFVCLEHSHRPFFIKYRPRWEHVIGNLGSSATPIFLFTTGFLQATVIQRKQNEVTEDHSGKGLVLLHYTASQDQSEKGVDEDETSLISRNERLSISIEQDHGTEASSSGRQERPKITPFINELRTKTLKRLLIPYAIVAGTLGTFIQTKKMKLRGRKLLDHIIRFFLFKTRGPYYYIFIATLCVILLPNLYRACSHNAKSASIAISVSVIFRYLCIYFLPREPFFLPLLFFRYVVFYILGVSYKLHWYEVFGNSANGDEVNLNKGIAVVFILLISLPILLATHQFMENIYLQLVLDFWRHVAFMGVAILTSHMRNSQACDCQKETSTSLCAKIQSFSNPLFVKILSDMSYTILLYHLYFIEAYYEMISWPQSINDDDEDAPTIYRFIIRALWGLFGGLGVGIFGIILLGKKQAFRLLGAKLPPLI